LGFPTVSHKLGHIIKKKGVSSDEFLLTVSQQDNKAIMYGNYYIKKYISRTLLLIYLITWYLCLIW